MVEVRLSDPGGSCEGGSCDRHGLKIAGMQNPMQPTYGMKSLPNSEPRSLLPFIGLLFLGRPRKVLQEPHL